MREIKFRAFIDGEMISADDLAFNEYAPLIDQLANCDNLMQFTGLTDKNGVKIYEGDIMSPIHYQKVEFGNAVVEFKKGMFCFAVNKPFISSTKPITESFGYGAKANNHFIVIGNIHENPELLCAKK